MVCIVWFTMNFHLLTLEADLIVETPNFLSILYFNCLSFALDWWPGRHRETKNAASGYFKVLRFVKLNNFALPTKESCASTNKHEYLEMYAKCFHKWGNRTWNKIVVSFFCIYFIISFYSAVQSYEITGTPKSLYSVAQICGRLFCEQVARAT